MDIKNWRNIQSNLTRNRSTYALYNDALKKAYQPIDFYLCAKNKMDYRKCVTKELSVLNSMTKKPAQDIRVEVTLRYVSPQGRVDVSKSDTFSYENLYHVVGGDYFLKIPTLYLIKANTFINSLNKKEQQTIFVFQKTLESIFPEDLDFKFQTSNFCCISKETGEIIFTISRKNKKLVLLCDLGGENQKIEISSFNQKTIATSVNPINDSVRSVLDKKNYSQEETDEAEDDLFRENNIYYKIYSLLKEELLGNIYKATPSEKALCKSVKNYFLNTYKSINGSVPEKFDENTNLLFYGCNLGCDLISATKSAKIIYCFFKANTIIERIKQFEDISNERIITSERKLIRKIFSYLILEQKIQYEQLPSLVKELSLAQREALDDILENFKAYETK